MTAYDASYFDPPCALARITLRLQITALLYIKSRCYWILVLMLHWCSGHPLISLALLSIPIQTYEVWRLTEQSRSHKLSSSIWFSLSEVSEVDF